MGVRFELSLFVFSFEEFEGVIARDFFASIIKLLLRTQSIFFFVDCIKQDWAVTTIVFNERCNFVISFPLLFDNRFYQLVCVSVVGMVVEKHEIEMFRYEPKFVGIRFSLARSCSQTDDSVAIVQLAEAGLEFSWKVEKELVALIDEPVDVLVSFSSNFRGIEHSSRSDVHRSAEDVVQICEESVVSLLQQSRTEIEANDAIWVLKVIEHREKESFPRFSVA